LTNTSFLSPSSAHLDLTTAASPSHSTPKPPLANNKKTLRRKREIYARKGNSTEGGKEASMLEKLACVECMRRSKNCATRQGEKKKQQQRTRKIRR